MDRNKERELDEQKITTGRYGFFRIVTRPIPDPLCVHCHHIITAAAVRINGSLYHELCYNNK